MGMLFSKKIVVILLLSFLPTMSVADLKSRSSSDIMAEIDFLEEIFPRKPSNISLGNSDERAFLSYLATFAICEGWDYEHYSEFVDAYEREIQPFVPTGRTFYIKLLKGSYESRANDGCEIDLEAQRIVEGFYGDVGDYYWSLQRQDLILKAIAERREEMVRRTLGSVE